MEVREDSGCLFWPLMFILFLIGLATFPYGIAVWVLQVIIILTILFS